jgi:hypothetical protein
MPGIRLDARVSGCFHEPLETVPSAGALGDLKIERAAQMAEDSDAVFLFSEKRIDLSVGLRQIGMMKARWMPQF